MWTGPPGTRDAGDLTDVATTTTVSNTISSPIPVDDDGTVSVTDGTLRLWGGTALAPRRRFLRGSW